MAVPIIGIDLGTSNCSVAVVDERGVPRVLADAKGRKVVPSIVSFHASGEVLVGADAKHRRGNDPRNTIFSIKRIMGRAYSAREIGEAKNRSPFAIYKGDNDKPLIVTRAGKYTPEEISAVILDHMRKIAERSLGHPVEQAVITVPANFNQAQRQATTTAAEIAGLIAVRMINEPTAAAIAYGHGKQKKQTIAVYDFGGGTFDVSILRLNDNVYEVLATAGDTYLGGDDIDNRLVDHEVKQFLAKHRVDLGADHEVIERLRSTVEKMKCDLSTKPRAVITAEGIAAGAGGAPIDLTSAMTREEFVHLIKDIVDRSFPVVDEAMRIAGLTQNQIDEVILVGGTTRIPYVRERVASYFGLSPRTDVDPEQAVALGAAIQASGISALLDRRGPGLTPARALPLPAPKAESAPKPAAKPAPRTPELPPSSAGSAQLIWPAHLQPGGSDAPLLDDDLMAEVLDDDDEPTGVAAPGSSPVSLSSAPVISQPPAVPAPRSAAMPVAAPVLMEVTPRALSIATVGGFCEKVIDRNAQIPLERTREFTTARDQQETVEILVASGDSRRLEDNLVLGTLVLSGLPPMPRGEVKIAVTIGISVDGILEVSGKDPATGVSRSARIELQGTLSPEDMAAARDRFGRARIES